MNSRRLEFSPTEAVESARRRGQYIDCPACGSQSQRYLFHRTGVRFVRCRACDLVYADPVDPTHRAYFDISAQGQHDAPIDRKHASSDFVEAAHEPAKVLQGLSERLTPGALVAVAFANMKSIPSRLLRRRWKRFFDKKIAFYNADNLEILMWRAGFRRLGSELLTSRYSLGYLAARLRL